jgi:hypothetical protein
MDTTAKNKTKNNIAITRICVGYRPKTLKSRLWIYSEKKSHTSNNKIAFDRHNQLIFFRSMLYLNLHFQFFPLSIGKKCLEYSFENIRS